MTEIEIRQAHELRLARALAIVSRATTAGSVFPHRIGERWVSALGSAIARRPDDRFNRSSITEWVKTHALSGWVIVGEAAQVLHGMQEACGLIEWATPAQHDPDDAVWFPWLGCHVDHPAHPCPCCGFRFPHEPGQYEICPSCRWEDEGQSWADSPDEYSGPNHGSLRDYARELLADPHGERSTGPRPEPRQRMLARVRQQLLAEPPAVRASRDVAMELAAYR